jgi:hypothetical protein
MLSFKCKNHLILWQGFFVDLTFFINLKRYIIDVIKKSLINNLDLYILEFDIYGKDFPKSQKLSPDAYVQMVMQLAYFR